MLQVQLPTISLSLSHTHTHTRVSIAFTRLIHLQQMWLHMIPFYQSAYLTITQSLNALRLQTLTTSTTNEREQTAETFTKSVQWIPFKQRS